MILPGLQTPCPCRSQKSFGDCCSAYLREQAVAADPVTLMRSRYTAFCVGDLSYLKATWNPETYPEDLSADEPADWISLEILDADVEGSEAEVEVRAQLIFDNKLETLHEVSQFDLVDGRWLYHSGEFQNESAKPVSIAASAPCPCGSGKVFKHCHFKRG